MAPDQEVGQVREVLVEGLREALAVLVVFIVWDQLGLERGVEHQATARALAQEQIPSWDP